MPLSHTFRVNGASLVCAQFCETGWWHGATSVCAHYAGFKSVASVELDSALYERGLKVPLVAEGKIRLYHGTSPDVLPEMLDPSKSALVLLDAHYMGRGNGVPDPKYGECSLIAELAVIFDMPWDEMPTIVVDDVHLLRRPWDSGLLSRFDQKQWPELGAVKRMFPCGYSFVEDEHVMYCLPER